MTLNKVNFGAAIHYHCLSALRYSTTAACDGVPDDYLQADAGKGLFSIRLHLSSASDTIGHAIFIA